MVAQRASAVAHAGTAILNPVPATVLDAAVGALGPLAGARVIDVGCGKGDLLRRLLAAGAGAATGVDRSEPLLAEAAAALAPYAGRCTLVATDARAWDAGPPSDVVCCVGSAHALAERPGDALARLRALTTTGGRVLLGDGYWRRPPDPAYLAALGATEDELTDLAGLRGRCEAAGLHVTWEATASEADWERYERAWAGNLRGYAVAYPGDPDAPEFVRLAELGWTRFDRWGRDTLGFALLVATAG